MFKTTRSRRVSKYVEFGYCVENRMTRAEAIRAKCVDCCGFQAGEVAKCTAIECPLWRYRLKSPEEDLTQEQIDNFKEKNK